MVAPTQWLRAAPLSLFVLCALAVDSDFAFYPPDSQSCLNKASENSNCNGKASVTELNHCLCGNENDFITNSAKCIGKKDKKDLDLVYTTMSGACADSDTPMTVSQSEFDAAADGDTPTTTKDAGPSSTGGSTNSATADPDDGDKDGSSSGGLSTGATIGIGVGAGVGGLAAVAGLIFFLVRRRRRRGEESHPMLPHHTSMYGAPTTFPPTEPSPAFESEQKPAWARAYSPSPSPANTNTSPDPSAVSTWNSPTQTWRGSTGAGPYATPETVAELPPQTATLAPPGPTHVFEMEGSTAPGSRPGAVEMQGSEVSNRWSQN